MMSRAWLARTPETAIEPEVEIIDPHHHLWDTETRYGRYDLEDLRIDTGAGHRVTKTVFIDCGANYHTSGPEELRPVGETEFVAGRAARSEQTPGATIAAIVGHADLQLGDRVTPVLEAHIEAGGSRFRGVRHSGARAEDTAVPLSRALPPVGLYTTPSFQAGARRLAELDCSFEAWQYHHQLADVLNLARAVPELSIVVNHLGGPLGVGRYAGHRQETETVLREGLTPLVSCENVTIKLGGVGMTRYGTGWEHGDRPPDSDAVADLWGDLICWCIDQFGPDRCMFESNYPVDGETTGYVVLWNAFKKLTADYQPSERDALFRDTARRVYRIAR